MPCIHADKTYTFVDRQAGTTRTLTSEQLSEGFTVTLPRRSGVVLFYAY
jgi:hypothetical protein